MVLTSPTSLIHHIQPRLAEEVTVMTFWSPVLGALTAIIIIILTRSLRISIAFRPFFHFVVRIFI